MVLKSILGMHIWAGARKNRPKIDMQAKSLCIIDAWNVVSPCPTSDTPNPPGDSRISKIMKSNQMRASAAAFHDNWDTDVEVKVGTGTKFMYNDLNGSYLLEIVSANFSRVFARYLDLKIIHVQLVK
eukprot:scaffold208_cov63-Attheya_sp.AAC.10